MTNAYAAEMPQQDGSQPEPELILEDDDFLRIVRAERMNSIGMADAPHGGDEIISEREQALEYYKGQMDDVPALPNRSKITTSEVRDAILTIIPDIVEIFLSGDEIGVFEPVGPEDEDAARQETAIVNHVIFGQNEAFVLIYDAVHDALLAKYGVIHFYPEVDEVEETEQFQLVTAMELEAAVESGEIGDVQETADLTTGEPLYTFTLTRNKRNAKVCTEAFAPEDFGVARDTGRLANTTYCVMRSRQRRQALIEQRHDRELVMRMPTDSDVASEAIDTARDLAGEHDAEATSGAGIPEMEQVIVHLHNVRVDADGDGRTEIWRVLTDENDTILLEKQKVPCIEFAGGSPVRQPHRPYGFSVADLLLDVQKIKTALTRMLLDMGYFAVNSRHEINVDRATESTVQDYLDNAPGRPVLSRGDAISPISPGAPGFNPFEALEYFATLGELRAGVMRASMGIDPDSLHETKGAALAMLSAAQRRVRFIARTLAETCFRDLFVGVHTLLRTYGGNELRRRIKGQWIAVDPSSWGTRDNMTVDIGSGSAGREYDLAVANNIRGMMTEIVTGQAEGAIKAEIVTPENIYNLARRTIERAGWKSPEQYVTDPRQAAAQGQGQQQQEDPELMKARAEARLEMEKAKQQAQIAAFTAQQNARIKEEEARQSIELKRIELQNEMQIAREKAGAEAELALYKADLEAQIAVRKVAIMGRVELSKNRPGGSLSE